MKKLHLLKTMLLLCALIVGSSSVWADEETSVVNFENELATYSDWKFTDLTRTQQEITGSSTKITTNPHGGSYFVKTSQSSGSWAQTANKIASPVSIVCYYTKTSSNTNSSSLFKIQVSSDGSKWTDVSSGKTMDKVTGGTWEELSADLTEYENVYVRVYYKGTSAVRALDDITLTYEVASSDPSSAASFANTTPSINFPATTTYSQVANTATGYTGVVTYEITANTAGATIDGSTVTVTQEGSVTVKATAPAVTGWSKSEATYTLTVNDPRKDTGLEYDEDSQEVTVGEFLDAPTLTNPNGLAVTYESDNEEIATVDEDGNVTGVAVGSTTITARFAGDATYKSGSASYTITVNKAITDGVFDFTEDEDYGSKLAKSGVKEQTSTWTAVSVTMNMTGRNCWYDSTPSQVRLYKATGGAAAGSITLSVPTGFVITNIDFTGASFDKMSAGDGTYSYEDDKKSATWEGEANSVTFTASDRTDINTITVTYAASVIITSAEYATYCNTTKALDFSETGITVYTATDNTTYVKLNEVTSGQIPANTPVVLYKAGAKGSAIAVPVIASADPVGSNDLSVVGAGGLSGEDGVYVLAKKANGVGFYLWDNSVTLNEGKVCLRTGAITAREFLSFDEGETTALSEVRGLKSDVRGEYFNLNGQRVAQPTKGLYIVNGRKVVIK